MGIIQVGETLLNGQNRPAEITAVEEGEYGLVWRGVFPDNGDVGSGYMPYELHAEIPLRFDWYGWATKEQFTLPNGLKVGGTSFWRSDPRVDSLEDYEKEWERTIPLMKDEPMGCIPLAEIQRRE